MGWGSVAWDGHDHREKYTLPNRGKRDRRDRGGGLGHHKNYPFPMDPKGGERKVSEISFSNTELNFV